MDIGKLLNKNKYKCIELNPIKNNKNNGFPSFYKFARCVSKEEWKIYI